MRNLSFQMSSSLSSTTTSASRHPNPWPSTTTPGWSGLDDDEFLITAGGRQRPSTKQTGGIEIIGDYADRDKRRSFYESMVHQQALPSSSRSDAVERKENCTSSASNREQSITRRISASPTNAISAADDVNDDEEGVDKRYEALVQRFAPWSKKVSAAIG